MSSQGRDPEHASTLGDLGDASVVLDARAKEAYRRRFAESDADIEEAGEIGDSERGRVSVTRAVRSAIERLREPSPGLREHLDRSIRTGTYTSLCPRAGSRAADAVTASISADAG